MSSQIAYDREGLIGQPAQGFLPRSLPLWMAASYVGLFIIRPWEVLFPELANIHFERLYAILMIACVAFTCGFRLRWNLQNAAVAAFLGAVSLSTMCAWDIQAAWDGFYVYLTLFICYCVLISVIRNPYDLLFIVGAYIGFMELYLGKALWEYFVYGRSGHTMGVTRLIGIENTFGAPNALAASIVISLPIWLFLWQCRQDILAKWPKGWRKWIVSGLAVYPLLSVVSVALTNSRNGMVNLCVFIFLMGLQKGARGRVLRNVVLALLVLCVAWLVLPEEQKTRIRTIWDPTINASAEGSKQGRFEAFHAAMEIFKRFPLTGVGPGNFIPYRMQYVDGVKLDPHNLVGQMIAETGLIGVGAFVFLVAATWINFRKTTAAARGSSDPTLCVLSALTRACCFSMILLFVEGISSHNYYRFNWLWLAAFCSLAAQFAGDIRARYATSEYAVEDKTS